MTAFYKPFKFTNFIFLLSFFSPLWAINGTLSGSGSEADPHLIEDYADFKKIDDDLTAYYQLDTLIDVSASKTENGRLGFIY